MKDNKPIILGVVVLLVIGGGLYVTGAYTMFLPLESQGVEYAELPDYGYKDGFNYEYLETGETQEELAAEYARENPNSSIDLDAFDVKYERVSATKSSDEIFNYGLQGNALYPGAMVLATSTNAGVLISIPAVQRGPGTFSINQEGVQTGGGITTTVDTVNLSNVRNAVSSLIEGKDLSQFTTVVDYQYQTIKSSNELNLSIGADVDIAGAFNIADKFNFNNSDIATRAVMVVKQICFEVTMDHPESLSGFFDADWATKDRIENAFGTEATPLYVSGVAYGRIIIITAESTLDENSLENTLTAGFKASIVDVGLEDTIASMTANNLTSVSVQIVGGNAEESTGIIQSANGILTGDTNAILDSFNYSSATPIMYRLSNLDGSTAMIQSADEYVIQTLEPRTLTALTWDDVVKILNDAANGKGVTGDGTLRLDLNGLDLTDSDDTIYQMVVPNNVKKLIIRSDDSRPINNLILSTASSNSEFVLELHDVNLVGSGDGSAIQLVGRPAYSIISEGTTTINAGAGQAAVYADHDVIICCNNGTLNINGGDSLGGEFDIDETLIRSAAIFCDSDVHLEGSGHIVVTGGDGCTGTSNHPAGGTGKFAIVASNISTNCAQVSLYGGAGGNGFNGLDGKRGSDGNSSLTGCGGGNGSAGGAGGDGGTGGILVGSDTFTVTSGRVVVYIGAGGDGGTGGRGGDGGNGSAGAMWHGTGGDGGRGGAGGDGGACGSLGSVSESDVSIVYPDSSEGGQGGSGGNGGRGGVWLGIENTPGRDGSDGPDGKPGEV